MSSAATPPRRRIPTSALAVWVLATVGLFVLAIAVARYLGGSGGHTHGHGGPLSTADVLGRIGAGPWGPLMGPALITSWQLNALLLAPLIVWTAWYLTKVALVPVRSPGERWPLSRTLSFLAGIAVLAYATNGAVAVYDQVLFTAHMIGHLLLIMLGPALLVAGRPLRLAMLSARPRHRERLERIAKSRAVTFLTNPVIAVTSYTVVIVGTHLTSLMDVIMQNTWIGQAEKVVYVVVGIQLFVILVGDEPIHWRLSSPVRWLILFIGMAVDTFTGIVLMQGRSAIDMLTVPGVDVNALSDTRTGGAIMWFGGDGIMAAIMIALVIGWVRGIEERTPDESGWLEQARRATFSAQTGAEAPDAMAETFDEDDGARASYNAWLQRLDSQH